MSQIVEFKLTPRGRFFFGQEVVFGGKYSKDERRRSYLVHSGVLPQQTTLLGALRELILRNNNALLGRGNPNGSPARAASLVGPESFLVDKAGQDFGIIKAISPLGLTDANGNYWQPHPIDDVLGKEEKPVRWETYLNGKATTWRLNNFDPKSGTPLRFSRGSKARKLDSFFREQTRVGVRVSNRAGWRNQPGKQADDQEGFYRQTFRANRNSAYAEAVASNTAAEPTHDKLETAAAGDRFSLVFRAEIDTSSINSYTPLSESEVIIMGGERSTFDLSIRSFGENEKLDGHMGEVNYLLNTTPLPTGYSRMLLTSDAFVDPEEIERRGGFVVGEGQSFRYFSTNFNKTKNFFFLAYRKGRGSAKGSSPHDFDPAGRRQSKRYTLLRRGSIIIVSTTPDSIPSGIDILPAATPSEKAALSSLQLKSDSSAYAVASHIINQPSFRQIGYNYLKLI